MTSTEEEKRYRAIITVVLEFVTSETPEDILAEMDYDFSTDSGEMVRMEILEHESIEEITYD